MRAHWAWPDERWVRQGAQAHRRAGERDEAQGVHGAQGVREVYEAAQCIRAYVLTTSELVWAYLSLCFLVCRAGRLGSLASLIFYRRFRTFLGQSYQPRVGPPPRG